MSSGSRSGYLFCIVVWLFVGLASPAFGGKSDKPSTRETWSSRGKDLGRKISQRVKGYGGVLNTIRLLGPRAIFPTLVRGIQLTSKNPIKAGKAEIRSWGSERDARNENRKIRHAGKALAERTRERSKRVLTKARQLATYWELGAALAPRALGVDFTPVKAFVAEHLPQLSSVPPEVLLPAIVGLGAVGCVVQSAQLHSRANRRELIGIVESLTVEPTLEELLQDRRLPVATHRSLTAIKEQHQHKTLGELQKDPMVPRATRDIITALVKKHRQATLKKLLNDPKASNAAVAILAAIGKERKRINSKKRWRKFLPKPLNDPVVKIRLENELSSWWLAALDKLEADVKQIKPNAIIPLQKPTKPLSTPTTF